MAEESKEKPARKNYALLAYELPYLDELDAERKYGVVRKDPYSESKESKQLSEKQEQPKYETEKSARKKTQKTEYRKKPDYIEYLPRKRKEEEW